MTATRDVRDDHHLFAGRQREDIEIIAADFIAGAGAKSDTVPFDRLRGVRHQAPLNFRGRVKFRGEPLFFVSFRQACMKQEEVCC